MLLGSSAFFFLHCFSVALCLSLGCCLGVLPFGGGSLLLGYRPKHGVSSAVWAKGAVNAGSVSGLTQERLLVFGHLSVLSDIAEPFSFCSLVNGLSCKAFLHIERWRTRSLFMLGR